mgnify:CR=1 FL=1
MNRNQRIRLFKEFLFERILVFDGGMGTSIQTRKMSPDDFGGPDFEGCNENLSLTRPEIIKSIHTSFLEAGADVIVVGNAIKKDASLSKEMSDAVHSVPVKA